MPERDNKSPALDDTLAFREPPASLQELALGAVFAERYRIDERLGAGGMGVVYRVHDLRLNEAVALKLLHFGAAEAAHRFVEEVRLARRVTHPNVARTHDIGEHQGRAYLTMEYVQGETLESHMVERGALPNEAAALGIQLASALEAAHAAEVIHRDLKPSNVILRPDGRAVITDFGIARAASRDAARRTAGIVGTPAYMSPEQAAGAPIDARSDIYTLGIMLYELLTARLPFEEEEPMAAALARLRRAPTHLSAHGIVPAPLAELTMWMLATEPDARPASAQVVRESLQAFVAGTSDAQRTGRSTAAKVSPGKRALAVLPFRYRGPPEHDYLGEGLTEELIDTLSRTRGIKVWALGAMARFADERDPMRVGAELSADAVVDGTVQLGDGRLRVAVRLHDALQGVQLWSDRFDVAVEDVFALQESIGKRLAEALRVELNVRIGDRSIPPEAVELFMRARRTHRQGALGRSHETLAALDRCLELAPDFPPALAIRAISAVRAWWLESRSEAGARREQAEAALARALELAPDEPETQIAQGSFAIQLGEYRNAARAFARALELAPTLAEAHQQLGNLEAEAGKERQGVARLELSLELDPSVNASRLVLGRLYAYDGRFEDSAKMLSEYEEAVGAHHPGLLIARTRIAMFRGDSEALEPILDTIEHANNVLTPMSRFFRVALAQIGKEEALALEAENRRRFANIRFRMAMGQVVAEIFSFAGHHDVALRALAELADDNFVDVVWLDRCCLLDPLRNDPIFAEAAAKTRYRAAATWLP